MEAAEKFSILLGQEELLYLLRSLGLPDLPGMGDQPWGGINQDTALFVLDAVGRSLLARGIVSFDSRGELVIDKAVTALLTAGAFARQIIMLTCERRNHAPVLESFYRVPEFDVCQSIVMPWMYRFDLDERSDMGRRQIDEWLTDVHGDLSTTVFQIEKSVFESAYKTASENQGTALSLLKEVDVEEQIAKQLVKSLASPIVSLRFQSVDAAGDSIKRNEFSVLGDESSCWLLTLDTGSATVSLKGVTTSELKKITSAAYLPFSL